MPYDQTDTRTATHPGATGAFRQLPQVGDRHLAPYLPLDVLHVGVRIRLPGGQSFQVMAATLAIASWFAIAGFVVGVLV